MNKLNHNKIADSRPIVFRGFVVLFVASLLLPLSAEAFFGDKEKSEENSFDASSLGISLAVNDQTTDSRTVEIAADLEEDVEYRLVNASSTGSFCSDLEVDISRDGGIVYSGSLALFTSTASSSLAAGDDEEWELQFSVSNTAIPYTGECAVVFDYEANQNGYNFGEAFFDVESDTFILYGNDFGTPPSQGVVLNEILPNPEGDDSQGGLQGEWIEVYNNGAVDVDLTGWYIKDLANNQVTFGPGTTLNGQTTIGVAGSGDEWVVLYMSGAILNNDTAETVFLYDNNGVLRDQYSYNAGTNDNDADADSNHTGGGDNDGPSGSETMGNEGKSDARIPDGIGIWVDPEPTAGEPNYVTEEMLRDVGYSESMIVELLARQENARQRYLELQRMHAENEVQNVAEEVPETPPEPVDEAPLSDDETEVVPPPEELKEEEPVVVEEEVEDPAEAIEEEVVVEEQEEKVETGPETEPEPEPEPEAPVTNEEDNAVVE